MDLPVFGETSLGSKIEQGNTIFSLELFSCTRLLPEDSEAGVVNILHVAADPYQGKPKLDQMLNYMKEIGFEVKRENKKYWKTADVLVFGAYQLDPNLVKVIIDEFARILGLVQYWDVLVYDTKTTSKIPPYECPIYTGQEFSQEGIHMLSSHVKLRDDVRFWEGFFAHMAIDIESYLDRVIGTKGDLNGKIQKMEKKINNDGLCGQNSRLFIAAAHLMRNSRNMFVHSQRNMSKEEKRKCTEKLDQYMRSFCALIDFYKGIYLYPNTETNSVRGLIKYMIKIALFTRQWAYEYYKMSNGCLARSRF